MSEWKTYKLGDLVTFQRGHDLTRTQMQKGTYPVAGSNGVIGFHNEFTTKAPGITIGRSGNIGNVYYFETDFWAHNTTLYIKEFKNCDPKFIYYLLQTMNFGGHNSGSAVPSLNRNYIHPIEVKAPDLPTQRQIAQILSSLDDKIELNLQMNQTLEAMAQAIFKEWFVNFNFPGFDGELVDGLPKGWKMGKLGEIAVNFDSKRIPLSNRERAEKKGIYPYYGAASILDYVEDYIFDGTYLLMGEDGTVVTSDGFPLLQYVWGKFWVNNHTHVLQGKAPFSTEYLFLLLSKTQITHIITGAVQPKINQGNMNKIECAIPPNEILEDFQKIILPLFEKRKIILDENITLTKLRDTLLPKLMSGKINVGAALVAAQSAQSAQSQTEKDKGQPQGIAPTDIPTKK